MEGKIGSLAVPEESLDNMDHSKNTRQYNTDRERTSKPHSFAVAGFASSKRGSATREIVGYPYQMFYRTISATKGACTDIPTYVRHIVKKGAQEQCAPCG